MKKVGVLLLITIGAAFMFLGCGKRKYSEEEITEIIEAGLQEKYEKGFIIQSVSERDRGTNFADHFYSAKCTDETGVGPFSVSIETDGTSMKDNYEGYLYKKEIDEELLGLLLQEGQIFFSEFQSAFERTETKSGSFRQYVESGNARIIVDISINAQEKKAASKAIFNLLDVLQEKNYGFTLSFTWNGKPINFTRDGDAEKITKQDVDKKIDTIFGDI